jgi:hypothetical protein
MEYRKSRSALAVLLAGACSLACTKEQTTVVSPPPSTTSPSSGVPEGDHTGANPKNDVDNNPEHVAPTPPGTPPEDQRIPEEVAPSK